MKTRKELSLRHAARDQYRLIEQTADGMCVIEDAAGRRARVKAEWLDVDGQVCVAGSFRKAQHVAAAEWTNSEVRQ